MQIYEVLKAEHARILDFFHRIDRMPGGREQKMLGVEVCRRIESLLDVEEYYLYPVLEIHPKTHDSTRRSHRENNKIRESLREWRRAEPDDHRRRSLLESLEKLMRRHIEREEHQLYVLAQYVIASHQAELLGKRVRGELENPRHRTAAV